MKELETIVIETERARASQIPAALATVVSIEGSAYRLPGARMLIVDGKWIAGSISGGCLEDDVVLRAAEAIARNEPIVTTYDTTSDDDIVFGVGLGCKGVITIFIEPLQPADPEVDFIAFAKSCLHERTRGLAATVVSTHGKIATRAGARLLSRGDAFVSDIPDPRLTSMISNAARSGFDGSRVMNFELDGGSAEVFLGRIEPPTPLLVFGAGHDAIPVTRLAKELGWHVTVIDHRPAYGNPERFPDADRVVVCQPNDVAEQVPLAGDAIVLLMTHNYLRDRELLELLLPSPVPYIGLLGPRRRTDQMLGDLEEKGVHPSAQQLARLYAPVGLDIGSEGPSEVALSILAEMQAVLTRHRGGHLRERKRPIHQAENAALAPSA